MLQLSDMLAVSDPQASFWSGGGHNADMQAVTNKGDHQHMHVQWVQLLSRAAACRSVCKV